MRFYSIERYYFSKTPERVLFYMDIYSDYKCHKLYISFSFPEEVIVQNNLQPILNLIVKRTLSNRLKQKFIKKLFKIICSINGIEQHFLPPNAKYGLDYQEDFTIE